MLFMNELVNVLFVEYGSIDSASSDDDQVNVLASAVHASASDSVMAASRCFFMEVPLFKSIGIDYLCALWAAANTWSRSTRGASSPRRNWRSQPTRCSSI